MGKQLGCDVEWEFAPEGTVFYAEGYFRNIQGDWWDEIQTRWRSPRLSLEELLEAGDYEPKPIEIEMEESELLGRLQEQASMVIPNGGTYIELEAAPIKSEWTATHYDNYYQLTSKDIEAGKVKIDAYFVNKMWKLNQKDDTGGLFHSLKTIARFGEKNSIERELKALYNQTKRMAELYGVELE